MDLSIGSAPKSRQDLHRPGPVGRSRAQTRIGDGLVGSVSFDGNGDVQISAVTILRVEPGARSVTDAPDAEVYGEMRVPIRALR
jgi:hypothetical protein